MYGLERKYTISLAHFRAYTSTPYFCGKVQKQDNKQNFDYSNVKSLHARADHTNSRLHTRSQTHLDAATLAHIYRQSNH